MPAARRDIQSRQAVLHFKVKGKRDKVRFVPVHVTSQRLIEQYLGAREPRCRYRRPVFRAVTNNRTGDLARALDPVSVCRNIVLNYLDLVRLCGSCQ